MQDVGTGAGAGSSLESFLKDHGHDLVDAITKQVMSHMGQGSGSGSGAAVGAAAGGAASGSTATHASVDSSAELQRKAMDAQKELESLISKGLLKSAPLGSRSSHSQILGLPAPGPDGKSSSTTNGIPQTPFQ